MYYHVSLPLLDCFHCHKNIFQYPSLKKVFSWPFISCHFLERIVQIPTVLCLTILSILSLLQIIGNTSIVIANDLHIARSYDQSSDHILFSEAFGMVDHFLLLKTLSPLSLGHHTFLVLLPPHWSLLLRLLCWCLLPFWSMLEGPRVSLQAFSLFSSTPMTLNNISILRNMLPNFIYSHDFK